jgi:glycosyltransferase involved in cell wall biosynthesis
MKETLGVVVLTLNEEVCMERCLDSVQWADEIVVVDSGSTDRTVEIARKITDRVYTRPLTTFSEQRNYGARMCESDWVLFVDADEVVSSALREEIEHALVDSAHQAYHIPFVTFMFGGWLRHCMSSQYHIRLYRRAEDQWVGSVHEKVVTTGSCGFIKSPILHYSHDDIQAFLAASLDYIWMEVEKAPARPKWLIASLFLRPPAIFIKTYLLQGGWLDGVRGFTACAMRSTYELIRWLHFWERFRTESPQSDPYGTAPTLSRVMARFNRRLFGG